MLRKGMSVFVVGFVWAGVAAQAQQNGDFLAGSWSSCQQMIDECKAVDAESIFYAANLSTMGGQPILGTCYVHDKSTCPNCACWNYVKVSYNGTHNGWDGGTGCIGPSGPDDYEASYHNAAALLKQLCESGACCCPQVTPQPCTEGTPVRARDPITGSCCTFPNRCSVPNNWDASIAPGDPRCKP